MKRFLVCIFFVVMLCLFTRFLHASIDDWSEDQLGCHAEQCRSLSGEADYLIGGIVSPMSGQVCAVQTDMTVQGAEPIQITRHYIAPYILTSTLSGDAQKSKSYDHERMGLFHLLQETYQGWQFLPQQKLTYEKGEKPSVVFTDATGIRLYFDCLEDGAISVKGSQQGLCNAAEDEPSGRFDPRNTRVKVSPEQEQIEVITPVGVSYFYTKCEDSYLLMKQRLASGKVLRYVYDNARLSSIESMDPAERFMYASVVVEGSPEEGRCVFTGAKAQSTIYDYNQTIECHKYLKKKRRFRKDRTKLTEDATPPILVGVSSPVTPKLTATYTDRFQLESVSGVTNPFKVSYMPTRNKGEFNHLSIQKLELPVGPNGDYQTVHSFEHIPARKKRGDRTRVVRHCDGSRTEYVFNKQVLPVCTRWYAIDGVLKKEERSTWNADQRLESFEVLNGQGQRVYAKQFDYDAYGNPVTTRYMGNSTENDQEESSEVRRQFSTDGRHLLLREEDGTGKVLCFAYLPETNLLTRRLVLDKEAIVKREFQQYDESHNLICTIIDDGKSGDVNDVQGVTQRTITRIHRRQQQPFLHMPDREEEYCLVNGEERLVRGSQYIYDQWGNVCRTEVYGSDRQVLHTIEKKLRRCRQSAVRDQCHRPEGVLLL